MSLCYLISVAYITYNINELNPDLLDVLSDWEGGRDMGNSHNAIELAKLYVLWYLKKLNSLPVFSSSGKVIVSMPKLRYFRRDNYAWLKHLEIPKLNWVLITLTLSRDIYLSKMLGLILELGFLISSAVSVSI